VKTLLLISALLAAHDYKVEDREPIHKTFANDTTLDVDAVSGSITVAGDNGNTIRVEGERIVRAADAEELARAEREVALDVNEKDGIAQLYVNGPFRDNGHASESHGFHEHRVSGQSRREYEVTYNFTIHVPRLSALVLHTINGDIRAADTAGKFDIHDINGGITLTNIAGSGTAATLNGSTIVQFRENPKADSYFKSFNGRVDVTFRPNLAADLRLKTFNGQAYTDFDLTPMAAEPKSNGFHHLRAGAGGPDLKFETFNGNIQIKKEK
jgi:DUF4097 and DUF4098 domain-containing protein YvlB